MPPSLMLSACIAAVCAMPVRAEPQFADVATLDHVAIHVRDADRSAAFYKDLFGLRQVPAPVAFARWLVLANGSMLHIVSGRTWSVANAKWDHIALSCADMSAMIARLDAKGITWTDSERRPTPQTRADGVQQIFVRDPDGYWVEINNAAASRPRDEAAIRGIYYKLQAIWNTPGMPGFETLFTEDADFVVITGQWLKGRDDIVSYHQKLLKTFYGSSRFFIDNVDVRFVRNDLAIAHLRSGAKFRQNEVEVVRTSLSTSMLLKTDGKWKIAAFHNTLTGGPGFAF